MTHMVFHMRNGIANIISCSICAKVPKGSILRGMASRDRSSSAEVVRVERGRDNRGGGVSGSYPYADRDPSKDGGIQFHGMSEGEEQPDDL